MTRILKLVVSLVVLASAASTASAQSNIRNARVESRPGADLAGTFQTLSKAAGPFWIGYAVPAQDPEWNTCCHDSGRDGASCCGRCVLDDGGSRRPSVTSGGAARGPVSARVGEPGGGAVPVRERGGAAHPHLLGVL